MIPRAFITAWRAQAPWPLDEQIEQDLVLSRALAEVFALPELRRGLAFRGGTALHKLFLDSPGRYSEDLDLVQVEAGPIGPILASLRDALDTWLGAPTWNQAADSVKLLYHYETTSQPVHPMRVKVEINTREHGAVYGLRSVPFDVRSPWRTIEGEVTTFSLEEVLATKMRALYQRRKGRDLYDLWLALTTLSPDDGRIVACLAEYLNRAGLRITRAEFQANLIEKVSTPGFRSDVAPLLRDATEYDPEVAFRIVDERLIARLPGEPWKGRPAS